MRLDLSTVATPGPDVQVLGRPVECRRTGGVWRLGQLDGSSVEDSLRLQLAKLQMANPSMQVAAGLA